MTIQLFLYLLAVILVTLSAFGVNPPRVHLGWLGLALWLFATSILPSLT